MTKKKIIKKEVVDKTKPVEYVNVYPKYNPLRK